MTNANPLISVIVPVYNVGEFLIPCLDSLAVQTYRNLEILLIDDGSTDGSGEVCDAYTQKDNRFKTIHKENGGVSSARNLGLDLAQGKYIAFVDSDDRVMPDYFEVLYRDLTEQNVDASFCEFMYVDENGALLPRKTFRFSEAKCIRGLDDLILSSKSFGVVWGGLFSASCLQGHRFSELHYGEDTLFMFLWLCSNPVVSVNPYHGYIYLQRQSSAIRTKAISSLTKRISYLQVTSRKYFASPIMTQEIRVFLLSLYANSVHNVAYEAAQPEYRHLKSVNLSEHINNILPDIKLLPKKFQFYIWLYAKIPWLYNLLARMHNRLKG